MYKFIKKEMRNDEVEMINDINQNDGKEILTMEDIKQQGISYDKMQGRPSITVKIQGIKVECLIDTGARVNVMSMKIFEK